MAEIGTGCLINMCAFLSLHYPTMSVTLFLIITVVIVSIVIIIIVIILYYVRGYAIRQGFWVKWAGVATVFGLDGPGLEFQWRRYFPHTSRPALGPIQLPIQLVSRISRRQIDRDVTLTTYHHLAPRLKEE